PRGRFFDGTRGEGCAARAGSGIRGGLPELTLHPMDVAPRPRGPGHDGAHHGVAGRMEVPCRVLAGRGVAAADVAALPALPELDPLRALFQALLTGAGRSRRWEIVRGQVLQVFTRLRHGVLLEMSELPESL